MFPSILAIGRKLNVIFGCAIWLAVAIFFAVVLLGSLWLDVVGVEKTAIVISKGEQVSFNRASWTRAWKIGLQTNGGGRPQKLTVSSAEYDRVRVGQTVRVKVPSTGVKFGRIRLAGQTLSFARILYERAWPVPEFVLSMIPVILLGWWGTRRSKWLWAAAGVCFVMALAYWMTPLSDHRPAGLLAEAEGTVVAGRLVERIWEVERPDGFDALVPHLMLAVEFAPEDGNGPVVAVDRVDASSVNLKKGSRVRVVYQRNDPRRALLVRGERTWWWMNLVSIGLGMALMGGLLIAGGLV